MPIGQAIDADQVLALNMAPVQSLHLSWYRAYPQISQRVMSRELLSCVAFKGLWPWPKIAPAEGSLQWLPLPVVTNSDSQPQSDMQNSPHSGSGPDHP